MRTVPKPWESKPAKKPLTRKERIAVKEAKKKKAAEAAANTAPFVPHQNTEGRERWKYNPELGRELPEMREDMERGGPLLHPLKAEEIMGAHKGKLIFVFGCGPSLLEAEQYKDIIQTQHISVGVNQAYLLIESQYTIFLDKHSWLFDREKLCSMKTHIFTSINTKAPGVNSFVQYRQPGGAPMLTEHIDHGLFGFKSSTYPAINLAYLLGASEIALLGVDLYDSTHFWTSRKEFHNNPVLRDRKQFWHAKARKPKYPGATKLMENIDKIGATLRGKGIKTWNCSLKSRVETWEKIELKQLLAMHAQPEVAQEEKVEQVPAASALIPERETNDKWNRL